jgi:hypothetical protein
MHAVMKKLIIVSGLIASMICFLSFQNADLKVSPNQTYNDSLEAERKRFTNEVLDAVKGNESAMAATIFKNLKTFNGNEGLKVTHLLAVMNYWGEALGVSCTHCHNTNDWSSDEKQTKNTARGMYALRQIINKQISFEIENRKEVKPLVNCGTCHRGHAIPKE